MRSKQDAEQCKCRTRAGFRTSLQRHFRKDRETYRCTVHDKRPLPCRGFDCHDNEKWKVWLDYDKKIINPVLVEETSEKVGKFYKFPPDEIEK